MHRALCLASIAAGLSGCLTVPLAADRPSYDRFEAPASSGIALEVVPLKVAHQSIPRCAAAGQASCLSLTQIVYAAYLVRHPKGDFLIDAAFSDNASAVDIRRLPFKDQLTFQFTVDGSLRAELASAGVPSPGLVFLTHAHMDHTSGLQDLTNPRVVFGPGELDFVRRYPSDTQFSVVPGHLRGTRPETFLWDGPAYENFEKSHDWFGDGSVVLVPLPGHTPGSIGIFLNRVHGKRLFFIGDTAWTMDAVELPSHKLAPLSDKVDNDVDQLSESLWRVHHLHAREPEVIVVPAHDSGAFETVKKLSAR